MAKQDNKFVSLVNMITNMANYLNKNTFFAGLIMIILNIGSRHVDLNLGDSVEMFIKQNIFQIKQNLQKSSIKIKGTHFTKSI